MIYIVAFLLGLAVGCFIVANNPKLANKLNILRRKAEEKAREKVEDLKQ